MVHSRMCAHIHRVASLKGAPPSEFVDAENVNWDTLGLQEALNRLQNLNRRERLKPLQPLIEELYQLMKVRQFPEFVFKNNTKNNQNIYLR